MQERTAGLLYRDASQRLCYEIFRAPAEDYDLLRKLVVDAFSLQRIKPTITFLDDVSTAYIKWSGFLRVDIDWDNWSGFFVTAMNLRAESLVEKIGRFLSTHPSTQKYLE